MVTRSPTAPLALPSMVSTSKLMAPGLSILPTAPTKVSPRAHKKPSPFTTASPMAKAVPLKAPLSSISPAPTTLQQQPSPPLKQLQRAVLKSQVNSQPPTLMQATHSPTPSITLSSKTQPETSLMTKPLVYPSLFQVSASMKQQVFGPLILPTAPTTL